ATPARRPTAPGVDDRSRRARAAAARSAASPASGNAAAALAGGGGATGPAGRRGSYSVLLFDPLVAGLGGVPGIGWVGAVQVGGIGLAAETVPQSPPREQHQHR